jgi:peptidyl-prolyl cis-trans isomerase SurA
MERSSKTSSGLMSDQRREEVIKEVVEHMIDDELVATEAIEMKLTVTAAEIDKAMENMAAQNGVDVKTLAEAIKTQGMSVLTYRGQLRKQILRYKVLNLRVRGRIKITEAEARQFYNDQVRDVRATGEFEGAHILVRVATGVSAAEAKEASDRAQGIMDRIKAGEDFAEVARKESEDSVTASRGGSLGMLDPGTIPSILDRAFLDMEVGEIVGPIRTAAGFHVITLISRENKVQPWAEVKDRILSHLGQREMARQEKIWLNELRLRTFIDVRL